MKTFHVNINRAEPGMVAAEDVYSTADQMIITSGTKLTDRVITRLKFYSISEIRIFDPAETSKMSDDEIRLMPKPTKEQLKADSDRELAEKFKDELEFVEEPTYAEQIKSSDRFKVFTRAFTSTLVSVREKVNKLISDNVLINLRELTGEISQLYASCDSPSGLFNMLMSIKTLDDTTYVHSVSVSLICNLFAEWLKFSQAETDDLVLAGLLHDVGKMKVPMEVLKKPGKLTDEEMLLIKDHPRLGYEILKDLPLNDRVKKAALLHHERCDGSGYPFGLKGDQIDYFSKIVAIADVYDAMTTSRVYRGPICPLEVINVFETEGLLKYDPKYLLVFLDNVMYTYLNHTVLLNTGEKGEIVLMNRNNRAHPIIRVGKRRFIDLNTDRDISIVGIL